MDSNPDEDKTVQDILKSVYLVISHEDYQEKLRDEESSKEFLEGLGIPHSAQPMLLNIVNHVEKLSSQIRHEARAAKEEKEDEKIAKLKDDIQEMILSSFKHIHLTFWISLSMSVALFIVGLVFLGTALYYSSQDAMSRTTLTFAGLGIADFVLLFYSRPWKDMATNLSRSQQAKIVVLSYIVGLPLLMKDKEIVKSLRDLTDNTFSLLSAEDSSIPKAARKKILDELTTKEVVDLDSQTRAEDTTQNTKV